MSSIVIRRLAVVPGGTRRLNGVDDPSVSGAAANVAGERLRDGFAVIGAPLLQQQRRTHQDAWNAEAALNAALDGEGFAQHPAHFFVGALERDHLVAFHQLRFAQAGQHGPPVHFHHAAAATPLRRATVLRRHDAAFLAQHFEEVHARLVRAGDWFTVESEIDLGQLRTSHPGDKNASGPGTCFYPSKYRICPGRLNFLGA